jgi:predicted GNAT family acetyltransferase
MPWTISEDLDEFAGRAGPFLRERPAHNTVELTVIETLRATGLHTFGQDAPLFGWWQPPGGPVAGTCLRTPPFPLLLGSAPEPAVAELADGLAASGLALPGVNAGAAAAGQFAGHWRARTGATSAVHMRNRLYRLGDLVPPRPSPPGQARVAGDADQDLLVAWFGAFAREVAVVADHDRVRAIRDRIGYGGLMLWEADGVPVSMAGLSRRVAGMTRVGPVYTPPGLRRRGYAGAVTAAVSQAALDAGAAEVLLFTDLANPASNSLYQRLGYQAVEDRVVLAFTPGPA